MCKGQIRDMHLRPELGIAFSLWYQLHVTQAFSPPRNSLILLMLLSLFWGVNWPIMKIVLAEWPIWTFRALCCAAGAIGLLSIAKMTGQQIRVPEGQWPRLTITALFNITGWNVLSVYGLSNLPSGRAAILAFTMPLWGILLGRLVLGEPLTLRKLSGMILGLGGLILLIGSDIHQLQAAPLGSLCMLAAALCWAIGTVLVKRYPVTLPIASVVGWQMLIGGLPIFVGALLLDTNVPANPSLTPMIGVIYNMLICIIFCYWAWFKILSTLPASISALSTLMIPCIGVFSGALVLKESPGWQEFTALALIIAALSTILFRPISMTNQKHA